MKEQIINIAIDRELWKKVGVKAILDGVDKKDVVDEALREYLKKEDK